MSNQSHDNSKALSFNFEGQQLRTGSSSRGSFYVAKDIASILEYKNTASMTRIMDPDEKGVQIVHTPGGPQKMVVITRPGLFKAILRREADTISNPNVREHVFRFQRYVYHVVLPQIGDTGGFIPTAPGDTEETIEARAHQIAQKTIDKYSKQIKRDRGLIAEANALGLTKSTFTVTDLADMCSNRGLPMGRNRAYKRMRKEHYVMTNGANRNHPYQKYKDMGVFVAVFLPFKKGGETFMKPVYRLTGYGVRFFLNKWVPVKTLEIAK